MYNFTIDFGAAQQLVMWGLTHYFMFGISFLDWIDYSVGFALGVSVFWLAIAVFRGRG